MNNIERICLNCKYFRGCGDWNLCCDLHYELYYEYDTCDKWEIKEELNKKGQYNG